MAICRRWVNIDPAMALAVRDALLLARTFAAAVAAAWLGYVLMVRLDRRVEAAATRFDCCLSQSTSDRVKGWLTTNDPPFEVGEAFQVVSELFLPEDFQGLAMSFP